MKPLEGYKIVELTDDSIVQERRLGEKGIIRITGNPNPPPEEHQKIVNDIARILLRGYQRSLSEKAVAQIGA